MAERAVVAMGTVLDKAGAREAIAAGPRFLVTPTVVSDVMEVTSTSSVPVMMGALTPTEVRASWHAAAQLIKIFPARVGGQRI